MNDFGIKELYDVSLKTTFPIEMGNRLIEENETIAVFDKIQLANFQENKKFFTAKGGASNQNLVWWEETKEVQVQLTQGVFSKTQLAIMTNGKLLNSEGISTIKIHRREIVETDEKGRAYVKHVVEQPYFIYDQKTGEKLSDIATNGKAVFIGVPYQEFLVDYYYEYSNNYEIFSVGSPLIKGFVSLEGKMRVKDDITGQVTTGIIRIPKLKLLSNLSMRLGQDAVPLVGRLDAVAVPTGERGQKKVMEIIFLSDDIDSDM